MEFSPSASEVFIPLETLYNAFDQTARRGGIFKVETIGDCYGMFFVPVPVLVVVVRYLGGSSDICTSLVLNGSGTFCFSLLKKKWAAAGLPDPRPDHAVAMVKSAGQCMQQLQHVLQALDRQLGPGTSELAMRFGIHSGPVTAGVLRGEKSRFQLFGDTVNTAARMETTGAPNKIHLSQQTVDLLIAAGKNRWVKAREELVTAKGKGQLQTYWLSFRPPAASSSGSVTSSRGLRMSYTDTHHYSATTAALVGRTKVVSEDGDASDQEGSLMMKPAMPTLTLLTSTRPERSDGFDQSHLIAWNVDVLEGLLGKIVALRTLEQQQEHQERWNDNGTTLDERYDDSHNGRYHRHPHLSWTKWYNIAFPLPKSRCAINKTPILCSWGVPC
jgi:class 3 adenylate cyclase